MVHNPISLKNSSDKKLKKIHILPNALDVLIVAHILKLLSKAKEFIWTKKSNEILKSNWINLEKENPNSFTKCVEMMLEVHDYKIENSYWGLELMTTILFVTKDLTL